MHRNKRLTQLIQELTRDTKSATTKEQLLGVVSKVISYDGPLTYDNRMNYVGSTVGVLSAAALYYLGSNDGNDLSVNAAVAVLGIASLVPAVSAFVRNSTLKSISDELFIKDALLDNGIAPCRLSSTDEKRLLQSFKEFDRGNYSRRIERLYKSADPEREFSYYQLHYVNKRVVTTTTSNGKTRTTTTQVVYDHYDRYGFILPMPYGSKLSVVSAGSVSNSVDYKPAYRKFNELFRIGAKNDHDAALLLTPTIQTALVEVASKLPELNIEINDYHQICIGFRDDMLNVALREGDLHEPERFYRELEGHTDLNTLSIVLELYRLLLSQWDENF